MHTHTPEKPILLGIGVAIVVGGWLFFMFIAKTGAFLAEHYTFEQQERAGYVEERVSKGQAGEASSDNLLFAKEGGSASGGKLQKRKSSELDMTELNI